MALQRLKEAAEKAKIELSAGTETEINLPYITAVDGVPKHLVQKLSRARFEQMVDSLVQRTLEPCRKALKDAGLNASQIDEVILVGGSTRIPRIQEEVEKFFGKKPNRSVNPDEVVAVGAAVQGGILSGALDDKNLLLLDVTPLSLGIETMGNIYDVVIEANTTIPTKKSKVYSTASDNQPQVEIHILQGERPMARDNRSVGRFILDGIPPAPRGVPQVEASTGLSKEEIARMKAEAEANAATDKEVRERAEKLNAADALMFQTEKQLREFGDKVPANHKEKIESALNTLREAHKAEDLTRIETASAALTEAWNAASQELYQATQGASAENPYNSATGGPTGNTGNSADVQDVEFDEVKN
jgi:molecular chaperone DnaK